MADRDPFDPEGMATRGKGGGWWLFVRNSDPEDKKLQTKREIVRRFVILLKLIADGKLDISDFCFSFPDGPGKTYVITLKGKTHDDIYRAPAEDGAAADRAESSSELGTEGDPGEGSLFFS